MGNGFLKKVYSSRSVDETRALYDDWSTTYEDEVAQNGYITPERCAAALAAHISDVDAPVLDFGCGTGLSGVALTRAGFTTIDGVDLSADMLVGARSKGIYRTVQQIEAGKTPGTPTPPYAAIAAMGVIAAGAAPASTIDLLLHALKRGGMLVLSLNDHTLEDPLFEGRISEWTDSGAAQLLFKENGPHMPGIHMNFNVYVIEKK